MVQRRPWPFAIVGTVILVALTIPVFSMRLGSADAGSDPTSKTSRRAYDLLAEGFGPGFNGPFLLAAELPPGGDVASFEATLDAVRADPGVAASSAVAVNPAGDTAIASVFPTTSPQDEATRDLLSRLRDELIPAASTGDGLVIHVGGVTAVLNTSIACALSSTLPPKTRVRMRWRGGLLWTIYFMRWKRRRPAR